MSVGSVFKQPLVLVGAGVALVVILGSTMFVLMQSPQDNSAALAAVTSTTARNSTTTSAPVTTTTTTRVSTTTTAERESTTTTKVSTTVAASSPTSEKAAVATVASAKPIAVSVYNAWQGGKLTSVKSQIDSYSLDDDDSYTTWNQISMLAPIGGLAFKSCEAPTANSGSDEVTCTWSGAKGSVALMIGTNVFGDDPGHIKVVGLSSFVIN